MSRLIGCLTTKKKGYLVDIFWLEHLKLGFYGVGFALLLIVKYWLLVELCELHESMTLNIRVLQNSVDEKEIYVNKRPYWIELGLWI